MWLVRCVFISMIGMLGGRLLCRKFLFMCGDISRKLLMWLVMVCSVVVVLLVLLCELESSRCRLWV